MKKTYEYCTVVPKFMEGSFYYYLVNNEVYDIIGVQEINGYLNVRVIDGDGEDYLYSWDNPGSLMEPELCGKWEIVEDIDGKLSCALNHPSQIVDQRERMGIQFFD